MNNGKKTDDYNNVKLSLKKNKYDNSFYVDHFGSSMISNQKRYKSKDIEIQSQFHWKDTKEETYLYTVKTNKGEKGNITLSSKSSNFKAAMRFIKKCLKRSANP